MFWKSFAILSFLGFALFGLGRVYINVTDGFKISSVTSNHAFRQEWESPAPSPEKLETIRHILDQPFHYFGKGCQTYVFESEDGQYVLKLFKHKHLRPNWLLQNCPLPSFLKPIKMANLNKKEQKLNHIFNSSKIGYEIIPQQTGIIYLHLNPTNQFDFELVLVDKIRRRFTLDPDQTTFILQHKAELAYPALIKVMDSGHPEDVRSIFNKIFTVMTERSKKGVVDRDPATLQNLGLLGNEAVILDIGQLDIDPSFINPEVYSEEILRKADGMKYWLNKRRPDIVPLLEAEIDSFKSTLAYRKQDKNFRENVEELILNDQLNKTLED